MREIRYMKMKYYPLTALLWYLAAICFFIAATIGKSSIFVAVGAFYICVGSFYLSSYSKHRNRTEEKDE